MVWFAGKIRELLTKTEREKLTWDPKGCKIEVLVGEQTLK
jgi:hypothetical protein